MKDKAVDGLAKKFSNFFHPSFHSNMVEQSEKIYFFANLFLKVLNFFRAAYF